MNTATDYVVELLHAERIARLAQEAAEHRRSAGLPRPRRRSLRGGGRSVSFALPPHRRSAGRSHDTREAA